MDQQEWMGYVSRLANGEYPVPVGMIQDYNDWRCRSIVGRALYWMGDTESAMRVLSTVVNVEPNMDDDPEYGLSEAEHKAFVPARYCGNSLETGQKRRSSPYLFKRSVRPEPCL